MGKPKKSLGRKFLPESLHTRMQIPRAQINGFVKKHILQRDLKDVRVLDAGSGSESEQYVRDDILAKGANLETLDLYEADGVDYVGDVAETPFKGNRYDIILCTQVLEHVPNPDAVCRELFRILKSGGGTCPYSAAIGIPA